MTSLPRAQAAEWPEHEGWRKRERPEHEGWRKREWPEHEGWRKREWPEHEGWRKREAKSFLSEGLAPHEDSQSKAG